jgi:hypothetical protein
VVTYILVKLLDIEFMNQTMLMILPKLAIIGIASLAVYMALSRWFKLGEVAPVLEYIKGVVTGKKLLKKK